MKKKNILTAALSLALVAVIAVGATLAYFTDKADEVVNTFTTGNIKIAVVDETNPTEGQVGGVKDEDTGDIAYGTETPIMPGDVISKQVSVSVDANSQPAWVALKLTVSAAPKPDSILTDEEAQAKTAATVAAVNDMIEAAYNRTDWLKGTDGVYYYQTGTVATGATANHLFDTLTLVGSDWDNDQAGMTFRIAVEAYAVQAANIDTFEAAKNQLDSLIFEAQS